jgi:hypothetical protein
MSLYALGRYKRATWSLRWLGSLFRNLWRNLIAEGVEKGLRPVKVGRLGHKK